MGNQTEKSTAIVVLGMHRSGTSALTGCLDALGVSVGQNLIPADDQFNAKGHWEHAAINALNGKILEALGYHWQDERSLPRDWQEIPTIEQLQKEAGDIIAQSFAKETLWAIKDPRLSRLLPIWLPGIQQHAKPVFVIAIRHPAAVAKSLLRRNHIPTERSYLIWLRYLLDAEYYTRGFERIIINYDSLLSDWKNTLHPLISVLESRGHLKIKDQPIIDSFLSQELRHHQSESIENKSYYFKTAEYVFDILLSELDSEHKNILDNIKLKLEEDTAQLNPWITQISNLAITESNQYQKLLKASSRIKHLEKMIIVKNDYIKSLSDHNQKCVDEINRVKSTFSWKITKPLRAIWNLFVK